MATPIVMGSTKNLAAAATGDKFLKRKHMTGEEGCEVAWGRHQICIQIALSLAWPGKLEISDNVGKHGELGS